MRHWSVGRCQLPAAERPLQTLLAIFERAQDKTHKNESEASIVKRPPDRTISLISPDMEQRSRAILLSAGIFEYYSIIRYKKKKIPLRLGGGGAEHRRTNAACYNSRQSCLGTKRKTHPLTQINERKRVAALYVSQFRLYYFCSEIGHECMRELIWLTHCVSWGHKSWPSSGLAASLSRERSR